MRAIVLVGLLAACTNPQGGTPITGCQTCGSGALRAGVVLANQTPFVTASSSGTIAYANGTDLVWLGSDFQMIDSTTIALDEGASSGEVNGLFSDAGGDTFADVFSMDDIDDYESQVGFGSNHQQLFHVDSYTDLPPHAGPIVGDPSANVVVYSISTSDDAPGSLNAVATSDGSNVWTNGYVSSSNVSLAAGPDGTIGLAGSFTSIEIAAQTLVTGVLIASIDPATGFATWWLNITGTDDVPHIAVGPNGEIALSLKADSAGDPVMLGEQTLGSDETFIALLDPTGTLVWSQQVPLDAGTIVTDGSVVAIGDGDTIAQVSSAGIDWQQELTGASSTTVQALANSQLVISAVIGSASIDGVSGPGTLIADVAL
jgi:hypothetical protein